MADRSRFLKGEATGYRQQREIFNSSGKNRGSTQAEELLKSIASIFRLRCTIIVPFEDIFECIKRNGGGPWRYIEGDRSLLRAFIQNYRENFEFPDSATFMDVLWKPNQRLVAKNESREMQIKKRDVDNNDEEEEWERIYRNHEFVLEYDALTIIFAIFHFSKRNKLHINFIDNVLMKKFDSSDDFTDVYDYISPSVKDFMANRYYLFGEKDGYFWLRSNDYTDAIYCLNEFLRDLNRMKIWKPLDLLIDHYKNSPNITPRLRADLKLFSRDGFLTFLSLNRFVFGIRLLKDYEVTSNVVVPQRSELENSCKNKKFLCGDFDDMLKQYNEERKQKKSVARNAVAYGDDDYFTSNFNPKNVMYLEEELPLQIAAQETMSTSANVAASKSAMNGTTAASSSNNPFNNNNLSAVTKNEWRKEYSAENGDYSFDDNDEYMASSFNPENGMYIDGEEEFSVQVAVSQISNKNLLWDEVSRFKALFRSIDMATQKIMNRSRPPSNTMSNSARAKSLPSSTSSCNKMQSNQPTRVQSSQIRKVFMTDAVNNFEDDDSFSC